MHEKSREGNAKKRHGSVDVKAAASGKIIGIRMREMSDAITQPGPWHNLTLA